MATMDYENENDRYDGMSLHLHAFMRVPCSGASSSAGYLRWTEADSNTEEPRYDRDRSASPRPTQREDSYRNDRNGRNRSASPGGRMNSRYVFHLTKTVSTQSLPAL